MKKIIIAMALSCMGVLTTTIQAQKVRLENSNQIVLELSTTAGMPAGAVTTAPKAFPLTPPPTNNGTWSSDNMTNGLFNQTVYHRLEIAPTDSGSYMDWAAAVIHCRSTTINGSSGWRLPTQRELMYMWIFRDPINTLSIPLGGTSFSSNYYWSSTEDYGTFAWIVFFPNGDTYLSYKTSTNLVRCVREL